MASRARLLLQMLFRHRRRLLTGGLKIALGRRDSLDERTRFALQYLRHLTGITPIRAITCRHPKSEGAGSQAHMVMNAIAFARVAGLQYHHTPFQNISHADRPMADWVAAWEGVFNLGLGETSAAPERPGTVNYCYNWADLEEAFGLRPRRAELCAAFKSLRPEVAAKYYVDKTPRHNAPLIVAVHIRRGDVTAKQRGRFTSTAKIARMLTSLKSGLDRRGLDYRIRVYSQGDPADFAELVPLGVEFFLDADPLWTLAELVEADVLLMAKGFYSYYAALVSDGIKLFEPQDISLDAPQFLPSWAWMSLFPDDHWLACAPDGTLDAPAFDRRLVHLLETRQPRGTAV